MLEQWLPVTGYEGLYAVSDQGRIRSLKPPRGGDGILVGDIDHHGYRRVLLSKNRIKKRHFVHRVVCTAFKGPPPVGTECGHRNGKPLDNSATNLDWITRSQNTLDAVRHGTHKSPIPRRVRSLFAKILDTDVPAIHAAYAAGVSQRALGRKYGVSNAYIYKILKGEKKSLGERNG